MGAKISLDDSGVRGYAASLGLSGIIDLHVHFMPDNVMRKVWEYFASAGPLIGSTWHVKYRLGEQERIELLAEMGVVRYGALCYPHKASMAQWLNDWSASFAQANPASFQSATFFPESGVESYVRDAIASGAELFKAHLQVGKYDPRDELLDGVWKLLQDTQIPVVIHCGSGPAPGEFTGPGPITEVLDRFPSLTLIIAHMGNPDYEAFLDLAAIYPNVYLDTTMVFTNFTEASSPFPPRLRNQLLTLGDKILLGSDFPNIPYCYANQIEALANLELGETWMRKVLYENAARLMKL